MFIGKEEIKSVSEGKDGNVILDLGDENTLVMNNELFESIKSEEEGIGGIEDNINHYFATKFLIELSTYGLKYYHIENISLKLENLGHNLREALVAKTFNCGGLRDFDVKLLLGDLSIDKQ
jgi:hypothetical protein